MKYSTAVITYFVIPAGATAGQRIILDGVHGEIDLFDSSNNLVGKWTPTAWTQYKSGSPAQYLSLAPDATGYPTLTFGVGPGSPAFINASDDGSGDAMPGVNSGQYINTGGILSSGRLFLARNDLNLAVIRASDQTRAGGSIRLVNADAYLESFANNTNIETLWSQVAAIGSTKTLQLTPDATKSGVGVTPTMIMQYNTRVTSAIIQIGGVGIWIPLAMTGGYTAGAVAPAITLLPDGTLAFRGILITRPAPASGDLCMQGPTNLVPTATRALSVMTLTNPNALLQLNFNTDGSFQIFGGGPNPPGNTNISLDNIAAVPVAF